MVDWLILLDERLMVMCPCIPHRSVRLVQQPSEGSQGLHWELVLWSVMELCSTLFPSELVKWWCWEVLSSSFI